MQAQKEQLSMRKTRLTLRSLIDSKAEIWVTNQTGKSIGKESGNIVFQVGDGMHTDTVIIPPGNDPVCLTDQVDSKSLETCRDLFKLVQKGALKLLEPEYAAEYYTKNEERKQVVQDKIQKMLDGKMDDKPVPQNVEEKAKDIALNPRIGDICLKARHKAIEEREALELILEQENALSEDDLSYLATNGVFKSVKKWAKGKLDVVNQEEAE
jgi:hypothetical protein